MKYCRSAILKAKPAPYTRFQILLESTMYSNVLFLSSRRRTDSN